MILSTGVPFAWLQSTLAPFPIQQKGGENLEDWHKQKHHHPVGHCAWCVGTAMASTQPNVAKYGAGSLRSSLALEHLGVHGKIALQMTRELQQHVG
jgi:hypothetical protein